MLISYKNSTTQINESVFQYNWIPQWLLYMYESNLKIQNSTFEYNTRVLYAIKSRAESHKNLVIRRNAKLPRYMVMYIVRITKSNVTFEAIMISENTGFIYITESKAVFKGQSEFLKNYNKFSTFVTTASVIKFKNNLVFYKNRAWSRGSAIRAIESRVYTYNEALFANNLVEVYYGSGGTLYLHRSSFFCQSFCNFTSNKAHKGGAIYAVDSAITIGIDWNKVKQNKITNISLLFIANAAEYGGAIYLEANSKLHTPKAEGCNFVLEFDSNTAQIGGAIYVNDYTSTVTCNDTNYGSCFIEAPSFTPDPWNGWIKINSTNGNTTFYGGLLDRCIAQYRYNIYYGPNLSLSASTI